MVQDHDETTQNPKEQFSEDILRIQQSLATADNEIKQVLAQFAECTALVFSGFAASIKNIRASFEEYAIIQPQLQVEWTTLSETQRQATVDLDTNFRLLDTHIDILHRSLAQLRESAKGWEPELSIGQQAVEEGGISIRDDLRRIHEIATQLGDDLERRI